MSPPSRMLGRFHFDHWFPPPSKSLDVRFPVSTVRIEYPGHSPQRRDNLTPGLLAVNWHFLLTDIKISWTEDPYFEIKISSKKEILECLSRPDDDGVWVRVHGNFLVFIWIQLLWCTKKCIVTKVISRETVLYLYIYIFILFRVLVSSTQSVIPLLAVNNSFASGTAPIQKVREALMSVSLTLHFNFVMKLTPCNLLPPVFAEVWVFFRVRWVLKIKIAGTVARWRFCDNEVTVVICCFVRFS